MSARIAKLTCDVMLECNHPRGALFYVARYENLLGYQIAVLGSSRPPPWAAAAAGRQQTCLPRARVRDGTPAVAVPGLPDESHAVLR